MIGVVTDIEEGDSDNTTEPIEFTVDFGYTKDWTAPSSELEPAIGPFCVGDRVRVKESVSTPAYGWGKVTHGMVGTVRIWAPVGSDGPLRASFSHTCMYVDFGATDEAWPAMASEVELVRADVLE